MPVLSLLWCRLSGDRISLSCGIRRIVHGQQQKLGGLAMPTTRAAASGPVSGGSTTTDGALVRIAIAFTAWAERWFPDAYIFVAVAVMVVSVGAIANGASPLAV